MSKLGSTPDSEVPAMAQDQILKLQESRTVLLSALLGVRGMAQIEATTGSRTWLKAVEEIDRCIKEAAL